MLWPCPIEPPHTSRHLKTMRLSAGGRASRIDARSHPSTVLPSSHGVSRWLDDFIPAQASDGPLRRTTACPNRPPPSAHGKQVPYVPIWSSACFHGWIGSKSFHTLLRDETQRHEHRCDDRQHLHYVRSALADDGVVKVPRIQGARFRCTNRRRPSTERMVVGVAKGAHLGAKWLNSSRRRMFSSPHAAHAAAQEQKLTPQRVNVSNDARSLACCVRVLFDSSIHSPNGSMTEIAVDDRIQNGVRQLEGRWSVPQRVSEDPSDGSGPGPRHLRTL